jgi:hypothetical protein
MNQDTLKVHKRAAWTDEPATAKQRQYLTRVGIPYSLFITKGDAGVLISRYQKSHPRTQINYINPQRRVPAWLKGVVPRKESIETWRCGLCNIKVKQGCHCPLCGAFEEGRCIICSSDHDYQSGVCDECLDRRGFHPIVLARLDDDEILCPLGRCKHCDECSGYIGDCGFVYLSELLRDLSPVAQEAVLHDKDVVRLLLKNKGFIHPIVCFNLNTPREAIDEGVRLAGFVDGDLL